MRTRHSSDQLAERQSTQGLHAVDIGERPFQVGDALPLRMSVSDMCRAFQISRPTFYRLERLGRFDAFEITPRIGARSWSGERVSGYLRGQSWTARTGRVFGRKGR